MQGNLQPNLSLQDTAYKRSGDGGFVAQLHIKVIGVYAVYHIVTYVGLLVILVGLGGEQCHVAHVTLVDDAQFKRNITLLIVKCWKPDAACRSSHPRRCARPWYSHPRSSGQVSRVNLPHKMNEKNVPPQGQHHHGESTRRRCHIADEA